jgi:hypothetical protein
VVKAVLQEDIRVHAKDFLLKGIKPVPRKRLPTNIL